MFKAALLLAVALVGQTCPPGVSCPRPAPAVQYMPPTPSPQAPATNAPTLQRVTVNGVECTVKGILSGGKVTVDWTDKDNLKAYWNACADAGVQAEQAPAPAAPIERPTGDATVGTALPTGTTDFGLPVDKIATKQSTYKTNSERGRDYAKAVDEDATDSGLHVTIIGNDEERQPVVNDMKRAPELAAVTRDAQVQDYAPDSWAIDQGLGFPRGKPAIIVQTGKSKDDPKGGRVVYATDVYPGPKQLAEELRKADPNYKPTPSLDNGELPFGVSYNQLGAAVVGGALALIPSKKGR